MSGVLSSPSVVQRSGLFGTVAAAHVVLLVMLSLTRSAGPAIEERTLVVDVLPTAVGGPQETPRPLRQAAAPLPRAMPERPKAAPVRVAAATVEKAASAAPEPAAKPTPEAPAQAGSGPRPAVEQGGGRTDGGAVAAGSQGTAGSATGAGTSEARFDADYLKNPAPPYPAISRRMGAEGKVVLRVLVTPEGAAGSLEIRTSSGSPRLDESALRTVRQWRFVPARRGDTAVQSWVLVPVVFKLES